MSDGKTEAMRGINFGYKIPSGDIKYMPNQKWHKIISFIKSGVRILGYCFIPFSLVTATILLILSEIIGIVEELV